MYKVVCLLLKNPIIFNALFKLLFNMKKIIWATKIECSLWLYAAGAHTKNQLSNQRISVLFVYTLVLKKGYTFDVF